MKKLYVFTNAFNAHYRERFQEFEDEDANTEEQKKQRNNNNFNMANRQIVS